MLYMLITHTTALMNMNTGCIIDVDDVQLEMNFVAAHLSFMSRIASHLSARKEHAFIAVVGYHNA